MQRVENCVIYNHNIGLEIRLGKQLYLWLINQEYNIVHSLMKSIPEIPPEIPQFEGRNIIRGKYSLKSQNVTLLNPDAIKQQSMVRKKQGESAPAQIGIFSTKVKQENNPEQNKQEKLNENVVEYSAERPVKRNP